MHVTMIHLGNLFVASALVAAELPPPTGDAVVTPEARLELLFTRTADLHGGLTEGPAVAPDGAIYFSDIPQGADRGMILKFDPRSKETTVFADDSGKSNGLIFNAQGHLLACEGADRGGRQVVRWNVNARTRETLTDRFQGQQYNSPNDLCVDGQGRIYFTDPRYLGDEPRELAHRAVYRIDAIGQVHEVTHAVHKPNGIAISPDGQTLYVADHDNGTDRIDPAAPPPPQGAMTIQAFQLNRRSGEVQQQRTLIDFGKRKGCDGMTVDAAGNLYLTVRDPSRPGVLVVNPAGQEIAFIPTGPADQTGAQAIGLPSNVEFGIGHEAQTLYVTVDTSLYRIQLKTTGFHHQYASR